MFPWLVLLQEGEDELANFLSIDEFILEATARGTRSIKLLETDTVIKLNITSLDEFYISDRDDHKALEEFPIHLIMIVHFSW